MEIERALEKIADSLAAIAESLEAKRVDAPPVVEAASPAPVEKPKKMTAQDARQHLKDSGYTGEQ